MTTSRSIRISLGWLAAALTLPACQLSCEVGDLDRDAGGADAGGPATDAGGPADCPLEGEARARLQEVVNEWIGDAAHVLQFSHPMERGFALSLTGVPESYLGFVFLEQECTQAVTFDPFCEGSFEPEGEPVDPFLAEHDRCSQLGCLGRLIGTVKVWWAMEGRTSPRDRHPFVYDTRSPAGMGVYDPNPLVTWVIDMTETDVVKLRASEDVGLVITPEVGAALDLGHHAEIEGVKLEEEIEALSVTLDFPSLSAGGEVGVSVALSRDAVGTGLVTVGGETIASIAGTFALDNFLAFFYEGRCVEGKR